MHSEKFVKRLAKKIKKAHRIPHHDALDWAAIELGFSNYKNFLNVRAEEEEAERSRIYRRPYEPGNPISEEEERRR